MMGATLKSGQRPKSLKEAGEDFLAQLQRHFENDRPDVHESELEAEEQK